MWLYDFTHRITDIALMAQVGEDFINVTLYRSTHDNFVWMSDWLEAYWSTTNTTGMNIKANRLVECDFQILNGNDESNSSKSH